MTEPAIDQLLAVMTALRDPITGCPWDRAQTFASIAPYTVEEAYEVADAIEKNDQTALRDELGDLLFQVVYHAQLAKERGWFDFNDIAATITTKMIRRHPHIFADAEARTQTQQTESWESTKAHERAQRTESGTLDGIATTLPALMRAHKLTARAARVGFDWPTPEAILDKLTEETTELRAELPAAHDNPDRITDELGDMLFVLVNLARKLNQNAESALTHANKKFERRFRALETALAGQGRTASQADLAEMEALWHFVKQSER